MNPALVRAQGLLACQHISDGVDDFDAVHILMAEGPYSFDTASSVGSADTVVYCSEPFATSCFRSA